MPPCRVIVGHYVPKCRQPLAQSKHSVDATRERIWRVAEWNSFVQKNNIIVICLRELGLGMYINKDPAAAATRIYPQC